MSRKKEYIDRAIDIITVMQSERARLDSCNKIFSQLYGDFAAYVPFMPPSTEINLVALLDFILGEEMASYYLYECTNMDTGGYIQEKNGTHWKIETTDDLRKYIYHVHGIEATSRQ